MPTVTFDGRSFMLDGRRIWLVSGQVAYGRIPREHWADRIHAARLAGVNTIETPVFWSQHEPRPGQFDFSGDNDLRHFVQLVGDAGLWLILRPGPYIGEDRDFGGLPTWLMNLQRSDLRTASGPFLEACSRYITAVADQVRDLQAPSPGKGGPILLVQNESGWTCGAEELSQKYLGELSRYLRESGIIVPTINANNLWAGVEGEIDTWTGESHMLSNLRQLAEVRPDQPRLVSAFYTAEPGVWGQERTVTAPPALLQRRLAEALAAGGQFNLAPLHGGTNFGFGAGRLPRGRGAFAVTGRDGPLDETGAAGPAFGHVRRICMFASRFGRTLAAIDPEFRPVTVDTGADDPHGEKGGRGRAHSISVVHVRGSQGEIAMVFGPDPETRPKRSPGTASVLLPDGSGLPVFFGDQSVVWVLLNLNLTPRATLDYCSFCALAQVGDIFVCYGPAGSTGVISVNGSPLRITAPKGRTPALATHEGVHIVICNEAQADSAFVVEDSVIVGAASVRADGAPVAAPGAKTCTRIGPGGAVTSLPFAETIRRGGRISLGGWAAAESEEYITGASPRYAAIDGPEDLSHLGAPSGYGWYRLRMKTTSAKRAAVSCPDSGDRLHFFKEGEPVDVVGSGPGAVDHTLLSLTKGENTVVVLAENLGRVSGGPRFGERKGLFGAVWDLKAFRAGRATIEQGAPLRPLQFRAPLWDVHEADVTSADRLSWSFMHRKKTPLFMSIDAGIARGVVFINDTPSIWFGIAGLEREQLDPELLKRGNNIVQIALLDHDPANPREEDSLTVLKAMPTSVRFEEGAASFTENASWAFAKWEPPAPSSYQDASKNALRRRTAPTWWRSAFTSSETDSPLMADLSGMTKGQIYINGRHLGRYFVSEAQGKTTPPQQVYFIPGSWVRSGSDNELVLFDEHGAAPSKVRLYYETQSTPILA
ncbi:MAG: beta-galactosidase [Phycisphaerales bacterium JB039]